MGSEAGSVPWTKRRRHYTRDELSLSLTQSLQGYGPDQFSVQPAERVRFAVQFLREIGQPRSLVASIPLGHARVRRRLLDHGWEHVSVGASRYARRSFAAAAVAVAAILDAYSIAYGAVGDDKGWNIVTPAFRPRTVWLEPWTGEEEPIEATEDDILGASLATHGSDENRTRGKVPAAAFGIGVGAFCAWAALQSFTASAGWTVGPGAVIVVVAGCVVLSTAVAISDFPDGIVRRVAYMWGASMTSRALTTFAFAAIPAIVWAILLIRALGTPPASGD